MRVCLMIEGQEDVTWDQWRALALAAEENGFEALFRSDHYLSVEARTERGSLDAWTTLAGLAAITSRIRLGTLVSPATFRHPSVLAKSAVTVDHISGGRVEIGLGAGWNELEHRTYGFEFFDRMGTRMTVMEEQAEILARSLEDETFSFSGQHYTVENLNALPKAVQNPRPPIVMGGAGGPRGMAIAARWADEYNTVFVGPEEAGARREKWAQAWSDAGRDPGALVFSVMSAVLVGADEADLRARAERLAERRGVDVDSMLPGLRSSGVVGTIDEAAERLREYEAAGVQRFMLQHLLHDDVEEVELIGRELIPRVST
ncbi:MAG TPA: TIGR03560 family F420-dependent LLM class oxidoreductase [Thermoleophilaceae bacterium]|nr:TIGR03560 family F420-dependent LLM class oxidoreductase [Thermoleophilaceae bacterium]